MKTAFMCQTCGVQYEPSAVPPARCLICDDDRQYVPAGGQTWISDIELRSSHRNLVKIEEPNLVGIGVEPKFAIGQRALLVQTPAGNILWDCVPLLDEPTFNWVQSVGGLRAIALSHPHYYSAIVEWSRAFGEIPVYIHAADREWVTRRSPAIDFWEGVDKELAPGLTLINCAGHFPGSTVLHWAAGADGRGCLLTGDTINVAGDRRFVSFMYSFPNLIPLNAPAVRRIVERVAPFPFERIYAAWFGSVVHAGAKEALRFSAERYIEAIGKGNG